MENEGEGRGFEKGVGGKGGGREGVERSRGVRFFDGTLMVYGRMGERRVR